MPILVRVCTNCGKVFEVLTTVKHSLDCPACGSEAKNIPQKTAECVYTPVKNSRDADLIHQSHVRRKAQLDARSDEIRSGELDLKLQGPKEYWPEAAKEKRLY